MPFKVAKNIGFCFGVKRAVEMCRNLAKENKGNVYTLGALIHNDEVIEKLKGEGIFPVNDISQLDEGDILVIRSHGVAQKVFDECNEKKLNVFDATCPFVKKIHNIVWEECKTRRVVIVGVKDHPEVVGINGNCKGAIIVENEADAEKINENSISIVAQTTFLRSRFENICEIIKNRCSDVKVFDTICDTTRNRQEEAEKLSRECDVMVVVGGEKSSNTKKLAEICKKNCKKVLCIEKCFNNTLENIDFNGIIGLVAGASTPDWMIMEVLRMENHDNVNEREEFANALAAQPIVKLHPGKPAKGTVESSDSEKICVSFQYKREGILYAEDYATPDMYKNYNKGDEIEVTVKQLNGGPDKDQLILTAKKPQSRQRVNPIFLDEEQWKGKVFDAVVTEAVKGGAGVSATVENTRVFIPASQIALTYVKDLTEFVNKTLQVKIIEVTKSKNGVVRSIVASAKEILAEQATAKKHEALSKLEVGQKLSGKVKHIESFGAFIEIEEGVEGLLPISSVSWIHINSIGEVLKVGQEIEVVVLAVDTERNRLTLGHKELTPKPWENVDEKYPVGSIVEGKVVQTAPYGAFVELEPTVRALVRISQLAPKHVETVEDEVKVGDTVRAKVLEVNAQERRIALSRRDAILEENPELAAELEREREARRREREEQRERAEQQRKARQAAADEERAQRAERREAERAERRSRREEVDYTIPAEERSTTSLASLLQGFKTED